MKPIHRTLNSLNDGGNHESIDPEILYKELFLGKCFGVALDAYDCYSENYPGRMQVGFYILHEDDGHWFTSESSAAAYWLPDLQEVAQAALTWVKANCEEFKPANCGGAVMGWLWKDNE
jgi:hypothetical protein